MFWVAFKGDGGKMRLLKQFGVVAICSILLLTSVVPVLAAPVKAGETVQVQFQNKTGETVRITLTGPATVSLTLGAGSTKADLATGNYKYSYTACGKTNTGTFKVRSNGDTLTLAKCTGGSGKSSTAQLVIQNKTDGTLYFTFTGPQTYYVTAPAGAKTKVSMVAGKYDYTVRGTACGSYDEQSGKVNIKGSRSWTWYCP
jgi:hypothetical protein